MKYMLILPAVFVFLTGVAQQNAPDTVIHKSTHTIRRDFSDEGKPKYHRDSDIEISEEEMRALFKKHQTIGMIPIIDKYGEQSAFYVDTTTNIIRIDNVKQIPPGEPFPEFVMRTINGKILDSDQLKGQKVVLYFNFFFPETISPIWKSSFEEAFEANKDKEAVFVLVTQNTLDEMKSHTNLSEAEFNTVTDAFNFYRRFQLRSFPVCVVLDESGNILSYLRASELTRLKDLL